MKKTILTGLVAFMITFVNAQTNTATGTQNKGMQSNEIKIPSQVMDKWNTDYPGMKAAWAHEGDNYTASYNDEDSKLGRMVTYDKSGKLVYLDMELNGTNYPTGIDDYYAKNYPNEKYTVWSSDDAQGNMVYYSKRKGNLVLWFDSDGRYSPSRPLPKSQAKK